MVNILLIVLFSSLLFANTDQFKQTDVSSADFLPRAFDAAKFYLDQENFDKVFPITQFYRVNFLNDAKNSKLFFDDSFYQLEIYALMKLCNWVEVTNLLKEYEEKVKELKLPADKYQKTFEQVEKGKILMTSLKSTGNREQKYPFIDQRLYRIKMSTLSQISHPENIIIKVEDKCEKRF